MPIVAVQTVFQIEAYPTGVMFWVQAPGNPIFNIAQADYSWILQIAMASLTLNKPIQITCNPVGSGTPLPNGTPTCLVIALMIK